MFTPKNEQGVIAKFFMDGLPKGWVLKEIRTAYPDALIEINGLEWRVEFEYSSGNFLDHRHDPWGCDLIICWENSLDHELFPIPIIALSKRNWRDDVSGLSMATGRDRLLWDNVAWGVLVKRAAKNTRPDEMYEVISDLMKRAGGPCQEQKDKPKKQRAERVEKTENEDYDFRVKKRDGEWPLMPEVKYELLEIFQREDRPLSLSLTALAKMTGRPRATVCIARSLLVSGGAITMKSARGNSGNLTTITEKGREILGGREKQ